MTIFSVQHFLEDHFAQRNLTDIDQYAVHVANVFDRAATNATAQTLARQMSRLQTSFFRRNDSLKRKEFEQQLATTLLRRFKKKIMTPA
jgi:hypothetical protein